MLPYQVIERATAPDGEVIELARHGEAWVVRAAGHVLMSSRNHRSEGELASLALQGLASRARVRVLVGGLGLGYTSRAVLDQVGAEATVVVAELVPAVVAWNQRLLGDLAGHPLSDARVTLHAGDVAAALKPPLGPYDVILLDVDNGPVKVAHSQNDALYSERGSRKLWASLKSPGVLAVWSAGSDVHYLRRLERAGFNSAREHRVRAHGARHVVFTAERA